MGARNEIMTRGSTAAVFSARRARAFPAAIAVTARPRQWSKNLLVFAAPASAGALASPQVLAVSLAAFAAFCLAASGGYFINDIVDRKSDALHPTKRLRPVASGALSLPAASAAAGLAVAGGLWLAAAVGWQFATLVGGYIAITAAYSKWLKNQAVVDIAVVASGFVARAIGGGVAAGVPISNWFLIVAGAGSLFMVAGKRYAEHLEVGGDGEVRATLRVYPAQYLRYVWMLASAVAITAYCLWSFEQSSDGGHIWYELSVVPFVMSILRYALLLEKGQGAAPEEIVLCDRGLQILALAWGVTFMLGVYLAR